MDNELVYYLVSPYSTPKESAFVTACKVNMLDYKYVRYEEVESLGAFLIKRYNLIMIEPIAMCFPKSMKYDLPQEFEYWKKRDLKFIDRCDALLVCMMTDWQESVGVKAEIEYANSIGKPVFYYDYNDNVVYTYEKETK